MGMDSPEWENLILSLIGQLVKELAGTMLAFV